MTIVRFNQYQVLPVEKLVKADWNYKQEDEALSQKLIANIKRNGQIENIIVRELDTGFFEIVNGNHRYDALVALDSAEAVVFNLGPITQSQAQRIAIETNETRFTTDNTKLSNILAELAGSYSLDDLLSTMPYTHESLDELLKSCGGGQLTDDSEVTEDNYSTIEPRDIYVRPGDLIKLGDHVVLCADSTNAEVFAEAFHGLIVHCVITDPPYGVSYTGKTSEALTIENDSLSEEQLGALWSSCLDNLMTILREGGGLYASIPSGPIGLVFAAELKRRGILRQQLVWNKDSFVLGHSDYHYKHEPILYGWKPKAAHYFTPDRTKTSVLDFARPKASLDHPTMKPLALWGELMNNSTKPGDVVFDPFLGSGTTLIVAEQLGRKCYGVELDPKYCQVIIERYEAQCRDKDQPFVCSINGKPIAECVPVN